MRGEPTVPAPAPTWFDPSSKKSSRLTVNLISVPASDTAAGRSLGGRSISDQDRGHVSRFTWMTCAPISSAMCVRKAINWRVMTLDSLDSEHRSCSHSTERYFPEVTERPWERRRAPIHSISPPSTASSQPGDPRILPPRKSPDTTRSIMHTLAIGLSPHTASCSKSAVKMRFRCLL